MGQRHSEADEAMREYGLREPEFRDMEIGFRINIYRNTEDALEDTTQGAEKTTPFGPTTFNLSPKEQHQPKNIGLI